jgi:hypothetical protein
LVSVPSDPRLYRQTSANRASGIRQNIDYAANNMRELFAQSICPAVRQLYSAGHLAAGKRAGTGTVRVGVVLVGERYMHTAGKISPWLTDAAGGLFVGSE